MLAWVAGGAIGLVPVDGRIGLTLAAVPIAAAAVRAYLAGRRLRGEVLGGPPRNLPPPSAPSGPPRTRSRLLTGTVTNVSTTPINTDRRPASTSTNRPRPTPA